MICLLFLCLLCTPRTKHICIHIYSLAIHTNAHSMNTADYTICNLDSQTYTTQNNYDTSSHNHHHHHHHPQHAGSVIPTSVYNHFNGINNGHNTGGTADNNTTHNNHQYSSYQTHNNHSQHHHGNISPQDQQQAINGHLHTQCAAIPIEIQPTGAPVSPYDATGTIPVKIQPTGTPVSPYETAGGGTVISHTNNQYGPYGPATGGQNYSYYAQGPPSGHLMPNGCLPPELSNAIPGSPAYPYPDHLAYGPGGLMTHPNQCSSPAGFVVSNGNGGPHQNSGQQGDGQVATYKWMTVKRSQPKTSPQSKDLFSLNFVP